MGTPARCHHFAVPKRGHSAAEYEDAAAWDGVAGRYAVADGASESAFAGEWARMLCASFVAGAPDYGWVDAARARWLAEIGGRPMPWYLEEKVRDGSFATFLGLTIDAGAFTWQAVAVGDSCLFQVRDDALLAAFPIERSDHFNTRPELIGSRTRSTVNLLRAEGSFVPGDLLLLMTDALAQWFLGVCETPSRESEIADAENALEGVAIVPRPWKVSESLAEETFAGWVELLRTTRRLKNDDVTLLVIDPFAETDTRASP